MLLGFYLTKIKDSKKDTKELILVDKLRALLR